MATGVRKSQSHALLGALALIVGVECLLTFAVVRKAREAIADAEKSADWAHVETRASREMFYRLTSGVPAPAHVNAADPSTTRRL